MVQSTATWRLLSTALAAPNSSIAAGSECPAWQPIAALAMDSTQYIFADGRRLRTLNGLDRVTSECLAIEVDTPLPGRRVVWLLRKELVKRRSWRDVQP